ncbi:lysoplasmalogenase [Vibrio sp. ZSDE26]|uniref:Lysoplasmalogenase n=1 Tax=Vibrio amylolyticus TaxID=2847292 RepID=A0A9X2BL64_9VIBR|nr:lysoplasmalogenase [Vibrio amylolyticus]MCK6263618.1 lysoplasmalogenase [Vibrio amylolyticus]
MHRSLLCVFIGLVAMWFLIVLFAIVHVSSINTRFRWVFYISKPMPIILLITLLAISGVTTLPYAQLIVIGLAMSLIGDIFLMHPGDKFLPGLQFFLIAHLFYFVAFFSQVVSIGSIWPIIVLSFIGLLVYGFIRSHLGKLKFPVIIYIVTILMMAWGAIEYRSTGYSQSAAFAFTGSILFLLSDFVLAVDRFRAPSFLTRQVVMISYYTAQIFIALSAYTFI